MITRSKDKLIDYLLQIGAVMKIDETFVTSPGLQSLPESLGFQHVSIRQKKNKCKSRLDADISSQVIRGITLDIPLIASNMSTVVNADFCILLDSLGAMGIMHRALDEVTLEGAINRIARKATNCAASVGVGRGQLDLAKNLVRFGANIICIDIAHGYSDEVFELARQIKSFSPETKIIIGNTTNTEFLKEASEVADAIKVGIAQGFACETKNTAGCTEQQFSAVLKFKEISKVYGIPIISDGGIREPADFTKAIAAGASSVMAGKIFASCPESAADTAHIDGVTKKIYAGMASRYVQEKWRGGLKDGTCAEGGVRYLDLGEGVEELLTRYSGALRSGITYAGATNILSLHDSVEFVRIVH